VRWRGRLVCSREGGYSTIQQGSGGRHQCLASCSRSHEAEPKLRHQNKLSGRVLGCLNPWIHACRNSAWMLLASGHGWQVCCTCSKKPSCSKKPGGLVSKPPTAARPLVPPYTHVYDTHMCMSHKVGFTFESPLCVTSCHTFSTRHVLDKRACPLVPPYCGALFVSFHPAHVWC